MYAVSTELPSGASQMNATRSIANGTPRQTAACLKPNCR